MRRLIASVAGTALATTSFVMMTSSPAAFATDCGATGGTVPGTPAQVLTVDASPVAVLYVDDRDYLDLDGDGVGGGLWIYMESNGQPGLQEGGEEFALASVPVGVPHIDPILVGDDTPAGHVITLFPNGFGGGGNLAEAAGDVETCADPSGSYDTIIF